MPLATKNGSLIVKSGRLAENCGCCGGGGCVQVTTRTPIRIDVGITSESQDQYSSVLAKDNQTGANAIAHTSFMSCEYANGTHSLYPDSSGIFRFSNDSLRLQLSFNSVIFTGQEHWDLQIKCGFLRMVQEYGAAASVRSKSVMASSGWSASADNGAFRKTNRFDDRFWRASPASRSNDGEAGEPSPSLGHVCGPTIICPTTGRNTFYNSGWGNSSMGVGFNGGYTSHFGEPESYGGSGCASSVPTPMPLIIKRIANPGANIFSFGIDNSRELSVPVSVVGYPYLSVFRLDFTLDSIAFIYNDDTLLVPT
jgi:hypothetical protein